MDSTVPVPSSWELVSYKIKFISEWSWKYPIPQVMNDNYKTHERSLNAFLIELLSIIP